ncbi:MAG: HEXXH motif-containing putative peptide modification protein [Nitrospirota bacterium]|nr:HEXXH motif-containing putative peptide modification protein [Nitrospirota bacterium]
MTLLDVPLLARLQEEFRLSMKRLLGDLCLDLESQYADVVESLALPVAYFRFLGQALERNAYAHWKVVGWIEALNDLVYFIDLLQQIRAEQKPREFAAQLFAECEEKFFENSYLDDLFPRGVSQTSGLERRLNGLCTRLTQELTQESLCLVPGLPMRWCASRKLSTWTVVAYFGGNVERAEMLGTMAVGMEGAIYEAPPSVKRALKQSSGQAIILVRSRGLSLKIGRIVTPLCTMRGHRLEWCWTYRQPVLAMETRAGAVTVGPTLVYGKDRQPRTVAPTSADQVARIGRAWTIIQEAWPEGQEVLALLTARIIPLKAKGVVSFSYRHRPGLSFINCFDRDNLDLIDDLIHENSHHHLNLLLRKQILYHGDCNQQIFYSPWRRSLRPLRGILHAAFTFTMGAMLFGRLSAWASGPGGSARWRQAGLTQRDLQRARFRCLEEVESVRYSIQDLEYASWHLKWLTGSGQRLVKQLAETIEQIEQSIEPHRKAVLASKFSPALRRHVKELQQARQTYGPARLSKA